MTGVDNSNNDNNGNDNKPPVGKLAHGWVRAYARLHGSVGTSLVSGALLQASRVRVHAPLH